MLLYKNAGQIAKLVTKFTKYCTILIASTEKNLLILGGVLVIFLKKLISLVPNTWKLETFGKTTLYNMLLNFKKK